MLSELYDRTNLKTAQSNVIGIGDKQHGNRSPWIVETLVYLFIVTPNKTHFHHVRLSGAMQANKRTNQTQSNSMYKR